MLALAATASAAPDQAAQLEELRARIAAVQRSLDQAREQRDSARDALRDVERDISTQLLRLRAATRTLRGETRKLEELARQRAAKQALLAQQREALARHARVAYMLGQQEPLKILLNQEDPAAASRTLAYHRYFLQARAAQIAAIQTTLTELAAIEPQLKARTDTAARLRDDELREKAALEKTRARERVLLAEAERRVETRAQRVARLRKDEERLARLVAEVRASLRSVPALAMPPSIHFADSKGRLPLPFAGKVITDFGSGRQKGEMRRKGVFLRAHAGQEVRSVFPGRVAYADWLRGFGLLLILEHGEGYMTLYGNGQSLYKKVGDWVEAGEVIAEAGRTGSFSDPGLYFEIRHNGEARNPLTWCRPAS